MPRTCIRFFALLLLLLVAVPAPQAAPLLQEGKKTLYQRVVSHPGAIYRALCLRPAGRLAAGGP